MFDYTVLHDIGSTVFFLVRPVKKRKIYICHVIQKQTNMRKCTFNFIGMLCALLLLVACASSRRTISNVSSETMDSLSLSTSDSLMYSEVQQGSTSVVKSDSSSTKQNISESGSDKEIVTEHITEIVDASGNNLSCRSCCLEWRTLNVLSFCHHAISFASVLPVL